MAVNTIPVQSDEPGQENEKPRSNRAPLSPVQDFAAIHMPDNLGAAAMEFTAMNYGSFTPRPGRSPGIPQVNHSGTHTDGDSMPDTMSWRNVISTQGGQTSLPPIPSQCLLPHSQSASTTASSQRYLRPFGGQGLNTLSGVPKPKDRNVARHETILSPNARQTADDTNTIGSGAATPTPGPSGAMGPPPPPSVASVSRDNEALQNLTETVNDHDTRIDRLETGSIYATAHEECSDKHDLTDLRVTELESRVDEVEKQLNDDTNSRRNIERDDDATLSVVSGFSAPALAADRAALTNQLEALQTRVDQLEASSIPSYSSPWELEVVFLPFPLKGIWQSAQEFKTARLSGGRDEWTQLPNTNSRATPDPHTLAAYDEWVGPDSDWLLPRACVPGRMIDQRLRSRGLIKTVTVRGGDARSVQIAVGNAFESILRLMPSLTSPRSPYAPDARVDRFFGLQQPWVPLRKVHKDARLRFLSPAELLTPVLWNSTFLMDSVVMKATGVHRLYITQPAAYLQDSHLFKHQQGAEPSWTWQRLRELTRVYPGSQASTVDSEVPEADALETYWFYNARLDEPSGHRQPSLSPARERAVTISRTSDGSTEQFFTGPSNPVVSMRSPVFMRAPSPLVPRERLGSLQPSFRAGSVPPLSSPILPSPRGSRRIPSFAMIPSIAGPSYQRHSSPLVTSRPSPRVSLVAHPTPASITKHRRRSTRSPSVRGMHNTPRWSNRSYSRSPSVAPFFQHMYVEEPVTGERRMTPFAYATPHSNAPPEYPPIRAQSRSNSRSMQVLEDEDEDMGFDDDRGSSTDDDDDIDFYEDQIDMLDDIGSESDHNPSDHPQPLQPSSSQPQGPEDEPLPGIEDNPMSDGENFPPSDEDDEGDGLSVASSPSEYTSRKQPRWMLDAGDGREMTHGLEAEDAVGVGFPIYEDEGEEEEGSEGGGPW
ncbi:hypothetical protein N0V82_003721 [Gnomoniopsis sp. IMI 355080]|nr:hypothetical protein N0V82_003721 [Gnomoniopsis sp. IMI 355080]